jgi:hypothetical protein
MQDENRELARELRRIAELLEAQHASPHRVRAYLGAADTVQGLDRPVSAVLEQEGKAGLQRLPRVGQRIASLIDEYVATGRIGLLERLEGEGDPEALFRSVPGVGPRLASMIHGELGIESLEELELAAHDGRLAALRGIGPRRLRALRAALGELLTHAARRRAHAREVELRAPRPDVRLLLDVDRLYREGAARDELPRIAPRRFNPEARAWLPVLHAERSNWSFTALYSNTARAHELGRTDDWVVIYYERGDAHGQCTVVTEHSGALRGARVVRGREQEQLREQASQSRDAMSPAVAQRRGQSPDAP